MPLQNSGLSVRMNYSISLGRDLSPAINQSQMNMNKVFKTNAIFKCIVTFKNGAHKILRVTIDMVAKITYEFRSCQKSIFSASEIWLLCITSEEMLNISEVKQCKFINERTGLEYLTIE